MNARSTRGPLTLVLVGAVSMGLAQPAAPPRPAPELAQIKFFAGTWSCEGNVPASPMAPARKTRTTVAVHADLGGFWYSGTVREEKTAENPHPISGMFHETYDPANKQFMMLWVDNMGGWATETSSGWDGDKIVYTGEGVMAGQKIPGRDTFVKKGPAELIHTAEMSMNGQWMTMVEESCKKAPPPPAAKK
ncbi:MAG: hypothetical protein DMF81_10035 [Acidobacteria bacterium]|nr:MAG: hypothetical protein DMF81_10035 [Acidobacteriota bacterium]